MATTIYGLIDPANPTMVRYIGQTRKRLGDRLKEHCRDKKKSHKRNWIIGLAREGRQPDILALATCTDAAADEQERLHISQHRESGCELLNHTDGGDGMRNWKPSDATRQKMSATRKGKPNPISEEGRQSIIEHLQNRVISDVTRQKMSQARKGKKLPEGTGAKMSKARTGRQLSDEHKSNLRKAIKEWWEKRKAGPTE